jgi:hypothetical protein
LITWNQLKLLQETENDLKKYESKRKFQKLQSMGLPDIDWEKLHQEFTEEMQRQRNLMLKVDLPKWPFQ